MHRAVGDEQKGRTAKGRGNDHLLHAAGTQHSGDCRCGQAEETDDADFGGNGRRQPDGQDQHAETREIDGKPEARGAGIVEAKQGQRP
ncbi:hypothetical protein D9M72_527830 [compost metagenome]